MHGVETRPRYFVSRRGPFILRNLERFVKLLHRWGDKWMGSGLLVFTVTVAFLGRVNALRFSTNCIPVTSVCSIEFDSIHVFAMYD